MYEHRKQPLLSSKKFINRMLMSLLLAFFIISCSLFIGVVGYHFICHFDWMDSLLNASMILSGMGPVNQINNAYGKLFASLYALFSGVMFIATVGIIITPIVHRIFHGILLDDKN